MIDSYEEEDDDIFPMSNSLHNFSNINIFSTSPLEKGIIFSKIENKITEEIKMNSEMQIKYHSVLEQIRINKIHKDYNRKIYDAVLLQLLKDVRMRYESKMWKQFINSF
jgi:hypothetical protein